MISTDNYILGVDTGGTFTDFVLLNHNQLRIHKVLSTPNAPEKAILQGIKELNLMDKLDKLRLIHGSTVATNALLEHDGVVTAYVANRGLKDVLSIGRQQRKELYRLCATPKIPPVAGEYCFEIDVRRDSQGKIIDALSKEKLDLLSRQLLQANVQAVAINLLFAYLAPQDEKQIASYLSNYFEQHERSIYICCSHEILAEYKEYERGIATWLNAWLGPKVEKYLHQLQKHTSPAKLAIMQSSGGTMNTQYAARHAVHMLLSGPAGGVAAAQFIARQKQLDKVLTFDMGGTSTDVALIDGQIKLTNMSELGGYPVAIPMIEMHTIGAGGGSIASIDQGGALQVGPNSAGASPGPVCYAQGGTLITVSDANCLLGRLPKSCLLAGNMPIAYDKALLEMQKLAANMGLSVIETAQGVVDIANELMSQALRVMSVQKGISSECLTLISFGGSGSLHVCDLADNLGIKKALIPLNSGVLSAYGMLVSSPSRELSQTQLLSIKPKNHEQYNLIYHRLDELRDIGIQQLIDEGCTNTSIHYDYSLDLRYLGQSFTLNLQLLEPRMNNKQAFLEQLIADFHRLHQQRYGHPLELIVELVNCRVNVRSETKIPQYEYVTNTKSSKLDSGSDFPIYHRENMAIGQSIIGPALIMENISTSYIAPNWKARIDQFGHIELERG